MATSATFNEQDVRNALRGVPAPFMSLDVVAADMVHDISIEDTNIRFTVETKVPPRFVRDDLEASLRGALARHLPSLGTVTIDLRMNIPSAGDAMKKSVVPGVANTIAISSGKGGVGKSTVAVNLAVALAQAGARVGLIDADIYGPSIPLMMDVTEQPQAYSDGGKTRMLPVERHGVQLMSIGFLVKPEDALIWRGPMASGALKQFLSDVDWNELDYLLFDMPPGTGDIQLTLSQSLPLSGALIVTTPQDIALADARKGVRMFEKVSVPILGLVENMSYYICSHCGERDEIFDYGGGRRTAEDLGVPFLGEIPITTRVRVGGDQGVPIVALDPDSPVAASFRETAMQLAGAISERNLTAPSAPAIDISL
ncbi:MAG: iron-sulfur cluster carrier protein ApbC [Bacteroidota bacterium]|jgi:ATP-binding protein involved in chromosome partitioning|nr:iron-sulfur cluster carrier protein ApbC [Bacteroidota bacterium]